MAGLPEACVAAGVHLQQVAGAGPFVAVRRLLHRESALDRADQRVAPSQSELGISVQIHPCPPLSVNPGRPTASKEGRIERQPFTTCVGGTASSRFRAPRLAI